MADFPELSYGTVHGRFLAIVLDSADAAAAPDAEALSGHVTFSATAPILLVTGAAPDPATVFPQSVRVNLDPGGYLHVNGSHDVSLVATNDPDGNPVDWQWHVEFALDLHGKKVARDGFNFYLPADTIVDLTIVAPLIELSDGTIIIQGPPGESASDLINAQGDLITGDAVGDAAILPVGPAGTYLAPEPAAPLGLEWKLLPAPEPGVKHYANIEEAMAVRVAETGILHVDSVIEAFPQVDSLSQIWGSTGPGEFIFETSYVQNASDAGALGTPVTYWQRVSAVDKTTGAWSTASRYFTVLRGTPSDTGNYFALDKQVVPKPVNNQVIYGVGGLWGLRAAKADPAGNTVMIRDGAGISQINTPTDPLDIANKQYVDEAIGAIPPAAGGGLKVYATLAEAEAVRTSEVGTLHVENLAAAFPELASNWDTFKGVGTADLVITTTVGDNPLNNEALKYVMQEFQLRAAPTEYQHVLRVARLFQWDGLGTNPVDPMWEVLPDLPGPGHGGDGVAVTDPFGKWRSLPGYDESVLYGDINGNWTTRQATPVWVPDSVMRRDGKAKAQVASPDYQEPAEGNDIATVDWVNRQIAAIPPVTGGTPPLGTRRFLFDATPGGDPGPGHVSIENAGGQNRLLRISKTDADGNAVSLAPLAVNDSVALSHEVSPATIYARGYAASLATDAVTHWEFTAVRESGTGALPAEGTALILSIAMANSGGSSAPAGGGLKQYADVAELDLVRTAELGILHVENLQAAFPALAGLFPTSFPPFPADLLVTTSMNHSGANIRSFVQRFELGDPAGGSSSRFARVMQTVGAPGPNDGWNGPPFDWQREMALPPDAAYYGWRALRSDNLQGFGQYVLGPYIGYFASNPDSIALRDSGGRTEVGAPLTPLDAANKQYVDDAIAAAIAALP